MTEPALPSVPTDDLQFSTVEPVESGIDSVKSGKCCAMCKQPIISEYYAAGENVLCPACSKRFSDQPTGGKMGRLVKASLLGIGAGLVGAAIWFAVRRATGVEAGIIAIGVGFLVGTAIRMGSGGRGGLGYQILAVLITYCSIAANYMPDVVEAFVEKAREHRQEVAEDAGTDQANGTATGVSVGTTDATDEKAGKAVDASLGEKVAALAFVLALVFAFSLALPFLQGIENIIGLLIIGFALWEAWKLNALRKLQISGPYKIGTAPAA